MPQVGIKYAGKEYKWTEARLLAEEPDFPFPPPLVEAMAEQRDDQVPSASSIIGCLRAFELKRTIDYYEEANSMLPALFGTAFHSFMDAQRQKHAKPSDLIERRLGALVTLEHEVDGSYQVYFSGKPDFLAPGRLVSDWKSKVYIPQGFVPPVGHVRQVNIYNWLAAENGYQPAPTWELTYVSQTWALRFTGTTATAGVVGNYLRKRLNHWADAHARRVLPPPVPQLFLTDAKGQLAAPCRYCPVREACLAALKEAETEKPFS